MALATKRWVNGRIEEVAGPVRPRRLEAPVQRDTIPFSVHFYYDPDAGHNKARVTGGSVYINFLSFHKDGGGSQHVYTRGCFVSDTVVDILGGWSFIKVKIEIDDATYAIASIVVDTDDTSFGGLISKNVVDSKYSGDIKIDLAYCFVPTTPPQLGEINQSYVMHVGTIFIPFPLGFVPT